MTLLMSALGFPPPRSSDALTGPYVAGQLPPAVNGSPLGRFADLITATVSITVILAALLSHLGIVGTPDTFIDAVALVAVGVIYGTARGLSAGTLSPAAAVALDTINQNTRSMVVRAELNTAMSEAAHRRLDAINAPAVPLDHTPLVAGDPSNGLAK